MKKRAEDMTDDELIVEEGWLMQNESDMGSNIEMLERMLKQYKEKQKVAKDRKKAVKDERENRASV